MTQRQNSGMSAAHKVQMANGREQGRLIRSYLSALQELRPKRGRPRTRDAVEKQLINVNEQIGLVGDPLERVQLVSQRERLEAELESLATADVDLAGLQAGFIKVAKDYSDRHEITRSAWRDAGVPVGVLKEAGIA